VATPQAEKRVVISELTPNVVSRWNEIATNTINASGLPAVTPEEMRPVTHLDLATVHLAIYDAVMAIVPSHMPYAVVPKTSGDGASQEAAVASATYGVLKGLFPNRSVHYQSAYDDFVASLPANDSTARGIAIGTEAALAMLAKRANDGRATNAVYTPGTDPGDFRGASPVNTFYPFVRPFALDRLAQVRAWDPPPMGSTTYAADLNEVKALGGAISTVRTPSESENARFHSEAPPTFLPRNLRNFAVGNQSIADNARLMAMLWVALADAISACFESKYYFNFWRPQSAIAFADTDGNAATDADPAWLPYVPTPNHPEYPAAHACGAGAIAEVLSAFYSTTKISFNYNSTVTGTVHSYQSTDEMVEEMQLARIHGGMHFRTSTIRGRLLGMNTARWVVENYFLP
jgi:hypothetical protein